MGTVYYVIYADWDGFVRSYRTYCDTAELAASECSAYGKAVDYIIEVKTAQFEGKR